MVKKLKKSNMPQPITCPKCGEDITAHAVRESQKRVSQGRMTKISAKRRREIAMMGVEVRRVKKLLSNKK